MATDVGAASCRRFFLAVGFLCFSFFALFLMQRSANTFEFLGDIRTRSLCRSRFGPCRHFHFDSFSQRVANPMQILDDFGIAPLRGPQFGELLVEPSFDMVSVARQGFP